LEHERLEISPPLLHSDGKIKSFRLDIQNKVVELELLVKRIIRREEKIIDENPVPSIVNIRFQQLIEVSLTNQFPTG
jgi:hypothetical protein